MAFLHEYNKYKFNRTWFFTIPFNYMVNTHNQYSYSSYTQQRITILWILNRTEQSKYMITYRWCNNYHNILEKYKISKIQNINIFMNYSCNKLCYYLHFLSIIWNTFLPRKRRYYLSNLNNKQNYFCNLRVCYFKII